MFEYIAILKNQVGDFIFSSMDLTLVFAKPSAYPSPRIVFNVKWVTMMLTTRIYWDTDYSPGSWKPNYLN